MRKYRNSTAGSGRRVSACFKARRVHGEGPVVALHLCTHTCINMMFDMYVYRSPRVHIPWRHACENMLAQCPHRIAPYTLFDTCSHASKADPLIFFFGGKSPEFFPKLLVTTVTEVSPPFLGVPQIWRSRSGYKSIAVSFCDQLVCSRLLATQTRTSARDPVVSARGVRSELAEGGTSAPLGRRGGFSATVNWRLRLWTLELFVSW